MERVICGLQQIGIGVEDVQKAWNWYKEIFGLDIKVFEDEAQAPLMTRYTGGDVHSRKAILALSMDGGGGFEIWQFSSRKPEGLEKSIVLGDLGVFCAKIKSRDIHRSFDFMKSKNVDIISEIAQDPSGDKHFFVKDPFGNHFQIVESSNWFSNTKHPSFCGGAAGVIVGVSDIDKALKYYKDILLHEIVSYDTKGTFEDLQSLPNGGGTFRRVRLESNVDRSGPFSPLLGSSTIELIESAEQESAQNVFKDRFWGDLGFIHVCFDVQNMKALKEEASAMNVDFTVDSADSFGMGEASGRFAYIEDPDGTLIELVETHKVPLVKKIGWYLNLKNRKPGRALPRWMISCLRFSRVK